MALRAMRGLIIPLLLVLLCGYVQDQSNHPDQYTVVKGDTFVIFRVVS